ncbi:MAG: hypothetical protein JNK21_11035 [Rhodospirillaceae bacterium]|nr:hypothetical protein [Rhodospirillaceae bacterium]
MSAFMLTSSSGWAAAFMIIATVILAYALRPARGSAGGRYIGRMQAHVWIGFAVLTATLVHVAASMRPELMRGADGVGLTLATVALGVLAVQVALGLKLNRFGPGSAATRKVHFTAMLALVVLIALHVVMNSPLGARL